MDELVAAAPPATNFRIDKFIDTARSDPHTLTHLDLLCWLQGDLQEVLPHDIALAIWGTLNGATLKFDMVSRLPEIRTERARRCRFEPFIADMLAAWRGQQERPLVCVEHSGFRVEGANLCPISAAFKQMRSLTAHGCVDRREGNFAFYAFFSKNAHTPPSAAEYLRLLTPYIDMAARKVVPLPPVVEPVPNDPGRDPFSSAALTAREREILHWVRAGKTNEVIGTILGISPFTVKNHLKRVYQKLNVTNRAHAASKL